MFLFLLLACKPASISIIDSGIDSSIDSSIDSGIDCTIIKVEPSDMYMQTDGGPYDIRIEGCADPLIVACPEWITVTAPAAISDSGIVSLSPRHGTATPTDGSCLFGQGEYEVTIHLR